MKISDGDELYHTTWANVEDEYRITAPAAGTIAALNLEALQDTAGGPDAEDWLVEIADLGDDNSLVGAAQYHRECGVGIFGETDESLGYTSYG